MRLPRYSRRAASILLVSTITSYWGFSGKSNLTPESDRTDADKVDSYMNDAEMQQFNNQGELLRSLVARRIEHRTATADNYFDHPQLSLNRQPEQPPVVISARQGISSDNDQLIELRRDVVIDPQSEPPSQLSTEQLYIQPEVNFAWTGELVAYYRGTNTTQAVGMNAYFDQERVELLTDVRGHYEAN